MSHFNNYNPAPKKRKVWPWVVGILAFLLLAFVGCTALAATTVNEIDKEINSKTIVTLQATGNGSVDYHDNGNLTIGESVNGEWSKTVTWDWLETSFSVSSSFDSYESSPVSCSIILDGEVVSTNSVTGGIATCSLPKN